MRKTIKKYMLLIIAGLGYLIAVIYDFEIAIDALANTWVYIREMLEILPAVFVLTGLINAWVPAGVIIKNFGRDSGLKGKLVSLFVGTVSAGPIYAAFPLTQSLMKKGASISNSVIIISAWAVVKLPMFIVETKFLGMDFAITRYLLTIPIIILMGMLTDKLISREEVINYISAREKSDIDRIVNILPAHNCGFCGYSTCLEYARAISEGETTLYKCVPGGEEIALKLSKLTLNS
ncbi:MAG: permease [Halanaerobiales bacterium]